MRGVTVTRLICGVLLLGSMDPHLLRSQQHAGARLRLEEVWAVQVPQGLVLAGGRLISRDRLLAWTQNPPSVLFIGRDSVSVLGRGFLLRPVAARPVSGSDHEIEVLDAGRGAFVRLATTGEIVEQSELRGAFESMDIESATYAGERWFFAGRATAGGYRWGIVSHAITDQSDLILVQVADPDRRISGHLSRDGKGAMFTEIGQPFSIRRVPGVVDTARFIRPAGLEGLLPSPDSVSTGWISLPALQLDHGFVQVLSDLRSSRRILVRYSPMGETVSVIEIDVPLGFMDTLPVDRLLLATRSTLGGLELVVYEWRWSAGPW